MTDAAIIKAMRSEMTDDEDLRESLQRYGWVVEFPALRDENGMVLVGNRRLRIAHELGIKPVIKTLTIGSGEAADAERFKLALVSNLGGKPMSKAERQNLAIYLFRMRNWTQQRIGDALAVSHTTVMRYLDGISTEGANSPERTERRGRPKGRKPKPHKYDETTEKKAAELFLDEGKPVEKVAKELGVSEQVVIRSTERERGRREILADPIIDPTTLSLSAQEKLAVALRQQKKQQDAEFETRVRTEHLRREDIWLKHELEEFTKATKRNNGYRGVMKKTDYNNLMKCLHTDTRHGVSDDQLNRAFQMVAELKTVLVEEDRGAPPIPTWDELLRRRAEYDAKNKANAMKAAATRKARQNNSKATTP